MKGEDDNFRDWEANAFGFGYGTGEPHTIPALKAFFAAIPESAYDFQELEAAVTPAVAWLLINTLCQEGVIEYGTSPRFGWLAGKGLALKRYVDSHPAEALVAVACEYPDDYVHCYPDHCNCDAPKCANPFWGKR